MRTTLVFFVVLIASNACKNRDVNYGEGPNFSEIHEDIQYHFDQIAIEGSEYFILERDRNNPHEGFGFMALKGNDIKANQDSIKAFLKTILDFQVKQYAVQNSMSDEESSAYADELFRFYLNQSKSPYRLHEKKKAKD